MIAVKYVGAGPYPVDYRNALSQLETNVQVAINGIFTDAPMGEKKINIISVQHQVTSIPPSNGRVELLYTAQILYEEKK
ncbi:MAG: hypothetical protein Q8L29_02905 [archaeon]|nr:hypothetical protein [archaeon]